MWLRLDNILSRRNHPGRERMGIASIWMGACLDRVVARSLVPKSNEMLLMLLSDQYIMTQLPVRMCAMAACIYLMSPDDVDLT